MSFFLVAAGLAAIPAISEREARSVVARLSTPGHREFAVLVEREMDPDGKVTDCAVQQYNGSERAADRICGLLIGETFEPATDFEGQTIHSRSRYWFLADKFPKEPFTPDLVLLTPSLEGRDDPIYITAMVQFDAEGTITHCGSWNDDDMAAYKQAACDLVSTVPIQPMLDGMGNHVPFVQALNVRFEPAV